MFVLQVHWGNSARMDREEAEGERAEGHCRAVFQTFPQMGG